MLVYDYALGGDTVGGVKRQVHKDFLPHLATRPDWAPWSASDTLFITWIGINDCALNVFSSHDPSVAMGKSVEELFALQEELYQAGARNFLFIDVPPTNRFPARTSHTLAI